MKSNQSKYFGNGLGIAVNKSNSELVAELNKGLAAIKANGEYQKFTING
ncbi:amino acid ABC transporter periplasmic protein [Actinobacillus equuli]|nr:amino acid ABC transporter periplasmic protein [Actinobacillus equuli]